MAEQIVKIPDMGGAEGVDVIEVLVKPGDQVDQETSLLTLEGDKASMDVPSPVAGVVLSLSVKVGDKVSAGDAILTLETGGNLSVHTEQQSTIKKKDQDRQVQSEAAHQASSGEEKPESKREEVVPHSTEIYAGPAVRRLAHELDIDLREVKGTGDKGRVTKEDVKRFLSGSAVGGSGLPFVLAPMPKVDFAKFGKVERLDLNKIKRATAANLHRNWVSIPHVTQFEVADITDLESFRQKQKDAAAAQGVKLTPIAFIMKAVVSALKQFPTFNASLDSTGNHLILKKYFHVGVAVDTPQGLVVPVIKEVDRKSLFELAQELGEVSRKARTEGLGLSDMQGGCFTISSLGGIGGTAFTPIINAPEVAILGVSKAEMRPVYMEPPRAFEPRLMLPLSLSYDHRVIDGAEAARFIVFLASRLADIQTLLL